jgi:hypothetical protein
MLEKLKSRKLWIAVLTAALVALCKGLDLPLSEVEIGAMVAPAVAYIFAQGKVDAEETKTFGALVNGGNPVEVPVKIKVSSSNE